MIKPSPELMFWGFAFVILVMLAVMQWHGKLPSGKSLQELSSVINSRGGNIMVLAAFSVLFFWSALRFTYWMMARAAEGKLSATDALGMAAFTWMTGSAFGGAFTSMVKAMTGESSKARGSDDHANVTNTLVVTGSGQTSGD